VLPMTDRRRLRNQFTGGLALGILMVAKVFWNPFGPTSPDAVWAVRLVSATGAGVAFHLAWTKYVEYREKYPRQRDVR
jgi:hypothetical protein